MVEAKGLVEVITPYLQPTHFKKGDTLWLEGDTKGMLIVLKKGRVKIYRVASNGTFVTLFIMKPNDIFGFLPLIDHQPYPVSAQALDDIDAFTIDNLTFNTIIKKDPTVCISILKYLAHYLRHTFNSFIILSSRSALTRVASALMGLLEETDFTVTNKNQIIKLPVSAKEYASIIGLTPESFSRKITDLLKMGIIIKNGTNTFTIIDKGKLFEMANEEFIV